MSNFDFCVIGAGASGSVLAIELAKKGKKVCVVDKNEQPAKKLLVTGNGRCNITNKNMSSEFYNQNIDLFLNKFGYLDTIKLFENYGLDIYADDEGRCYPISNSAKTVQFVLANQFKKHKISFFQNEVCDVEKENEIFKISLLNGDNIFAKKVVFACGINEFSDSMIDKFKIEKSEICPSLVALKTKESTKRLDGERIRDVKVTAKVGEKTYSEFGEILFKDSGLSGICIFNLSTLFSKNKEFLGKILINLLPKLQKSEIYNKIFDKMNIFENVEDILKSMFSKELALEILKRVNFDKDIDLQNKDSISNGIEKIVDVITNLEYNIVGNYNNNQVFSGGVCLTDLTENLESKKNSGIYFCGEICDVDGICGGYNLQWAFTSAMIISRAMF